MIQLERALAKRTDLIVAVGDQVRADLLDARIGRPDQYAIIAPGLEFPEPPPGAQAREELDIPPQTIVISFIGRLTAIKRADRFADAVAILVGRHPGKELRFLVAGDGESSVSLAAKVRDEHLPVTLLGWRADIPRILAATDIVVLTSDNEGTPISLIQSALAGVPVVATDVGSVKNVVLDGMTGLLAQPSAEAIADKLEVLIQDDGLRAQMGQAARAHAGNKYSVKRLATDHSQIYERLLGNEGKH